MPEPQVAEHTGLFVKILLIVTLPIFGVAQALFFFILRSMGGRIKGVDERVGRVEDSVGTCFKKNDATFIPRPEYEATIKAMNKRGDEMHKNLQTLVDRSHGSREGD